MAAVRFHLDEHIDKAIAVGLKRRGIDVTTASDAGLMEAADGEHLAYAANEGRVLVTRDQDFLVRHGRGDRHAGIFFCQPRHHRDVGHVIRRLVRLANQETAGSMANRLEWS